MKDILQIHLPLFSSQGSNYQEVSIGLDDDLVQISQQATTSNNDDSYMMSTKFYPCIFCLTDNICLTPNILLIEAEWRIYASVN